MGGHLGRRAQWLPARDGRSLGVINPADGQAFDAIACGGAHEVDLAVAAARTALNGPWGRMSATERGRVLMAIGRAVLDHTDELAPIEARDTDKPMSTARNDIIVLARYFEYYGGAADKVHGESIPFVQGHQVTLLREPLGVTAHIIPWNCPAQMLGCTLAPALAMGNATVLKPAEDTSLSALRFAEIATQAGLPEGALNIVTGRGEEAGAALAGHAGIDFISFTGSNEVGTLVQQAATRNAVKCVLELGGKSPQIVFADADLDRALPLIVRAIVQNAGQTCTAGSRLLVQREIFDSFVAREEVFGPVMAALPFDDEAEAIAPANATDCGLWAAVWTENGGRQQRVAKAAPAGQVFINCYGAGGGVELPFGGTQRSGHGREKGLLALEELSSTKTLVQFHG